MNFFPLIVLVFTRGMASWVAVVLIMLEEDEGMGRLAQKGMEGMKG